MVSLLGFFVSIGVTSSNISVLAVAQQFDLGRIVTIRSMIQAGLGSPDPTNPDFEILPMNLEGSGNYRADRFRIYFQHPQKLFPLNVPNLVSELRRLFPQLFNGVGDEVNSSGLTKNTFADTFFRHDKPFNGEPTLQFEADIRTIFEFVDAPDLHDDWVGFVHQDPDLGFSVQTLARRFEQLNDAAFGLAVLAAVVSALPPGAGAFAGLIAGVLVADLNRYHFLAGRRSWVIAQANQARGPNFIAANPPVFGIPETEETFLENHKHIYILETAAVDRFSSWVIELADLVPGVVLSNMDQLVAEVWTILLSNFVKFMGFEPVSFGDDHSGYPTWFDELRDVRFIQGSFSTESDLLTQDWVQDLLNLHPGLV